MVKAASRRADGTARMGAVSRRVNRVKACMPQGQTLRADEWAQRHLWIVRLLWAHAPALVIFGLIRHEGPAHALADAAPVIAAALLASRPELNARTRSLIASLGLMTCSALLVHIFAG